MIMVKVKLLLNLVCLGMGSKLVQECGIDNDIELA
jgi:hypothetical protein